MSTIDDQGSAANPFSGDESGKIFETPDVVMQAPNTSDRMVDTQSGFLFVIRRVQERLSLSLKRRIGTPPQSAILLTPDESMQLSRILSDSWIPGMKPQALTAEAQALVANLERGNLKGVAGRGFRLHGNRSLIAVMVALALFNFAVGALSGYFAHVPTSQSQVLSTESVDKFSRRFVTNLLDFNAETYKTSQVKAMSYMTPDLLASYWQETNFPLDKSQIESLGQSSKLTINKVTSQKLDSKTALADVFAQVSDAEKTNEVHLQLKLKADEDGQISVIEQNDLSEASKADSTENKS